MRLTRKVSRLEAGAAAARAEEPAAIGLIWTQQEKRIDADALAAGEYIACDLYYDEEPGQFGAGGVPPTVRTVERVTVWESDLGKVYGPEGERIGRVTAIDGSMLTWEGESED
jgi:hypothetical protein